LFLLLLLLVAAVTACLPVCCQDPWSLCLLVMLQQQQGMCGACLQLLLLSGHQQVLQLQHLLCQQQQHLHHVRSCLQLCTSLCHPLTLVSCQDLPWPLPLLPLLLLLLLLLGQTWMTCCAPQVL
jgi:hypothetical protein